MSGPAPQLPTGLFLGGRFVEGSGSIEVRNPYSGELVAEVATGDRVHVARAVHEAAEHLPPTPPGQRAGVLERAAGIVAGRSERFAQVLCREAGKPIRQARGEVARCVDTLTFSAAEARTLAGETVPFDASAAGVGKIGFVRYAPIGILGAIAPFNFPLNLVAHKVGPAIAAGCPVVLKPAEKTPLSALLLAEALADAGLPAGALSVVTGTGAEVGGALVDHPEVAMISFTGSGPVGWGIRERAPRKHVALELGNSTPIIVTEDADLGRAASRIAASGFTHAGQSCISVQRVYVHESVHAVFLAHLIAAVEGLVVGDPSDEATDVGPVITPAADRRVREWIAEAVDAGATIAHRRPRVRRADRPDRARRHYADDEGHLRRGVRTGRRRRGIPHDRRRDRALQRDRLRLAGRDLHGPRRCRTRMGRAARVRRRRDQRDPDLPRRPAALRRHQGQRQHARRPALRGPQHVRAPPGDRRAAQGVSAPTAPFTRLVGCRLPIQLAGMPRTSVPNPTRNTSGVIEAMPHYAGYSVDAVYAVRPAREIVAELTGDAAPAPVDVYAKR